MASNTAPSTFSPQMQSRILRSYSALQSPWKTAVLAGYEGARQSKSFNSPTRVGSNPNSTIAQLQRSKLSLQGEEIVKNTAFGRNLINRRRAYCSSGITYHPDTGDSALNKLVTDYCVDQWKRMGVNQSMQQAFGICADAMLPQYGDCALRWIRSEPGNPESELRLLAITGDRIGEVYRYVAPVVKDGITYYCGLFFNGPNITHYRIYERWYDTTYIRPENVEAADVIFFIDPIDTGVRGVSLFSAAVDDIRSSHEILKATKDTMQQQSKMAAIASNNSGSAMDYSYDKQTNADGTIEYQESYADGAVVKYQFNGDSYQVLRAEHPSQDFVAALRYLDQRGSLACGFPYEFLFSGSESGGAPFRGAFEIAGREIERLRNQVHGPRLDVIAYVTIMDGVERGLLPAKAGITRGSWQFTTLPSADAFRDAKSDIDQIRAGITSPQRVIANNLGTTADAILSETREWAIMVSKTVEDANRELVKQGYKPTVTAQDVAQVSDNPQAAAQAENLTQGKPTTISDSSTKSDTVEKTGEAPKPAAAMADFDESKHPRAKDGEFGSGGGGAKKEDAPAKPNETGGEDGAKEKPDSNESAKDNDWRDPVSLSDTTASLRPSEDERAKLSFLNVQTRQSKFSTTAPSVMVSEPTLADRRWLSPNDQSLASELETAIRDKNELQKKHDLFKKAYSDEVDKRWDDAEKGNRIVSLRFGNVPKGGKSKNYRDNIMESGVSAYEAIDHGNGQYEVRPNMSFMLSGPDFLSRPAFKLTGKTIGTGSDGEILVSKPKSEPLTSVKVYHPALGWMGGASA